MIDKKKYKGHENLAKAVKIKKLKSIDEALKLASTIKLSDKIRLNAFDQHNCEANLKTNLVEIGKQLSNLTQLIMAMMEKINKNSSDTIDKFSRNRQFNRQIFYSRKHNKYQAIK